MKVQHEERTYSTQYIVRTVEVTVPPPFRDWTPIGNLLMRALEDGRKKKLVRHSETTRLCGVKLG